MILCQVEDCNNAAAITFHWPIRASLCWQHYRNGCTCELDRDSPLCVVHGDERDTSISQRYSAKEK